MASHWGATADKYEDNPQRRREAARPSALDIVRWRHFDGDVWSRLRSPLAVQQSPFLFGLEGLHQNLGVSGAEVACTTVPEQGGARVPTHTAQADTVEKELIKRLP